MEAYWSSAPGVVGNAAEGSNSQSAWCQQRSVERGFLWSMCPSYKVALTFSGLGSDHYSWANVDSGLHSLSSAIVNFLNQCVGVGGCCHVFLLQVCWHGLVNSNTQEYSLNGFTWVPHWPLPLCQGWTCFSSLHFCCRFSHPGLRPHPFCSIFPPAGAPSPHLQRWPGSSCGIMVPWTLTQSMLNPGLGAEIFCVLPMYSKGCWRYWVW